MNLARANSPGEGLRRRVEAVSLRPRKQPLPASRERAAATIAKIVLSNEPGAILIAPGMN
jgi:hypothetical protein